MKNYDEKKDRLEKLWKKKGEIKPEDLVKDAQDPKSPFHNDFSWDDRELAEQARLQIARKILGEFRFEKVRRNTLLMCPMFRRDPSKGRKQGYVMIPEVKKQQNREIVSWELSRAYSYLNGSWLAIAGLNFNGDEQDLAAIEERLSEIVEELESMVQSLAKEMVAV